MMNVLLKLTTLTFPAKLVVQLFHGFLSAKTINCGKAKLMMTCSVHFEVFWNTLSRGVLHPRRIYTPQSTGS